MVHFTVVCQTWSFSLSAEIARDALHRTGAFTVVKGIFSPVHDEYKKKVCGKMVKFFAFNLLLSCLKMMEHRKK